MDKQKAVSLSSSSNHTKNPVTVHWQESALASSDGMLIRSLIGATTAVNRPALILDSCKNPCVPRPETTTALGSIAPNFALKQCPEVLLSLFNGNYLASLGEVYSARTQPLPVFPELLEFVCVFVFAAEPHGQGFN